MLKALTDLRTDSTREMGQQFQVALKPLSTDLGRSFSRSERQGWSPVFQGPDRVHQMQAIHQAPQIGGQASQGQVHQHQVRLGGPDQEVQETEG